MDAALPPLNTDPRDAVQASILSRSELEFRNIDGTRAYWKYRVAAIQVAFFSLSAGTLTSIALRILFNLTSVYTNTCITKSAPNIVLSVLKIVSYPLISMKSPAYFYVLSISQSRRSHTLTV